MSYFDPQVYNKQNLKEKDRSELDYYYNQVMQDIDDCLSVYESDAEDSTMEKMEYEIAKDFCDELKTAIGCSFQEVCVSIIDNYDEEVRLQEHPETYYYYPDEDEEDDEEDEDEDEDDDEG